MKKILMKSAVVLLLGILVVPCITQNTAKAIKVNNDWYWTSSPVLWTDNYTTFYIKSLSPCNQTYYKIDWGDGCETGWLGPYNGTATVTHQCEGEGPYNVLVKARNGLEVSQAKYRLFNFQEIHFLHPATGYKLVNYRFSISVDGYTSYYFDWGDGTNSGWIEGNISKAWRAQGYYDLLWKAKNANGNETAWSSLCLSIIGAKPLDGYLLFSPLTSNVSYLYHGNDITHRWVSSYLPGISLWWLGNNIILRTIKTVNFSCGGSGGGIQKLSPDGKVLWEFRYDTDGKLSHHDIKVLPNGNILMIAWENKTRNESIAAGRDPNRLDGDTLMPDHIIEVKPIGPASEDIVWEWHVWDHLIQDFNASEANYGVVADHPELVDINYGYTTADWLHTNSVDYNPALDQILLSVRFFNEIWIIDHSTTTQEAAGHTGGHSGKGGDLLYRWGNPEAYRAGNATDRKLFLQHDAQWIKPEYPGAGDILIYNNGVGRPGGEVTTVDEMTPALSSQGYQIGLPEDLTWTYDTEFFALYVGGATRLLNGNTLVCNGASGYFYEIDTKGFVVWKYNGPGSVFKGVYILPFDPQSDNERNRIPLTRSLLRE